MTSLNGIVAAGLVHLSGHYLLEQRGILESHDVPEDADTI
jgi:hypothetical protein